MRNPRMSSAQVLSDRDFLNLFDLKEISSRVLRGDVSGAKVALLEHYRRRVKTAWPPPPRVITDLQLNLDDLGKEELVAQADVILEYRFSPEYAMPIVASEGNIDWSSNPISSPEWLWRLNRHQWWPILGLAYDLTGDERYAAAFVKQMLDWVKCNPPPVQKDEKSPFWRLMEVGLRVRVSWIPTFGLFYKSSTFTDEAKLTMLRSLYDHARFL